ncbi:MAG: hypothetical protein GTN84_03005 [Hydrogenophaga sp.]|uniref:hypothetical protein n=1 Tax=Hydrogenophaga sp. TaxID=1904254 RepID=UPI00169DD031|nr:hypothetical protein [Hydrogenophaga sp.]NIM40414.1 hypothetical protein [Hydrogenophaga sp.]NIN25321.1 hypothetical protein [Hydrogenophaga sp.]NIN29888.1 hypothetical protein [Hydrogenophaga sp.]NIN54360.1 hypothetical protein [Hydrogenophaga sp.]NIO52899.1 hypothetical protein [Hydrogenophaga sp.]
MSSPNPLNPPLAEGIRRLGFRKWYERELLSSHAHMALAVVAAVAMLASFEAFNGASASEKLLNTAFVVLTGGVTLWALNRYVYLLMHAEELANQANCPRCHAYGQLRLSERPARRDREQRPHLVPVCCQRCAFEWDMDDGDGHEAAP